MIITRRHLLQLTATGVLAACGGGIPAAVASPSVSTAPTSVPTRSATRVFRDDRGVDVAITGIPTRVAAISNFASDLLVALGMRPVANTYFQQVIAPDYLARSLEGVPSLGQRASPNLEVLASLRPDLIVAIRRYSEPIAAKLQEIAPYVAVTTETYEESDRAIALVSDILGKKDEGERLNRSFAEKVARMAERAPGGLSAVFLAGFGDTPTAYYVDRYLSAELLARLKATNIAGRSLPGGPFAAQLSLENLLAKDPDVIFMSTVSQGPPFATNPIWQRLKAVRGGRVYVVGIHWLESHGPIARELVLDEAAHGLYPDIFPKPAASPR